MLALPILLQSFEAIGRWNPQVAEPTSGIDCFKLATGNLEYLNREALWAPTVEHRLRNSVLEAPDQCVLPTASGNIVSVTDTNVNRLVSLKDTNVELAVRAQVFRFLAMGGHARGS